MTIQDVLSTFSQQKILVIGDLILDRYVFGKVNRISPEAPIQIFDFKQEEYRLGGAANVAGNLVSLGCDITLSGCLGNDHSSDVMLDILQEKHIHSDGIIRDEERPTTIKTRFIAQGQHLLRVDKEDKKNINSKLEEKFQHYILDNIQHYNSVIISDYAKGFLLPSICNSIIRLANDYTIPVFVGPKGNNWEKYQGAYLLSANRSETEVIAQRALPTNEDVIQAGNEIIEKFHLTAMLITLSAEGMMLCIKGNQHIYLPTQAKEVYDVVGAGDTVLAMMALSMTAKHSWKVSMNIANAAAGIVVGKVGTSLITTEELSMLKMTLE
jgi:D-beta-D-heptose 7-phosphate kinase/D-beta-D-heptose 1-phosphate adenosyltransferase